MKLMDLEAEGVVTVVTEPTIKVKTDMEGQFAKHHMHDAGYDIRCSMKGEIKPFSSLLISTGLYLAIPDGYVGIIKSRSGLSVKHSIDVGAGVVDATYRGEVKVLLRNISDKWFDFEAGDKIAQMVVVPIFQFNTEIVDTLDETARGSKGFNSTGYK